MSVPPLIKAQKALGAGDVESARRTLNRHLRGSPSDVDALFLLGLCEQNSGNLETAQKTYEQLLLKNSAHFGAHYNLGLLLMNTGRARQALQHHDAAIGLQPGQFWTYINRGNARASLKEFESALQDYQQALAISPNSPEVHSNMGNALKEARKYEEALAAYDKALLLAPNFPEALSNRCAVLSELKRPEEALASVDKALQMAPNLAYAWFVRGTALNLFDVYDEALKSFDKALELSPGYAEAWYRRGYALNQLKQYQKALESLRKAMSLKPDQDWLLGVFLYSRILLCEWGDLANDLTLLNQKIEQQELCSTPFDFIAMSGDPALQLRVSRLYADHRHPAQSVLGPFPIRPPSDKIRLGFYSADFQTHPVALLSAELFELLDRSRFELIAFSYSESPADADPVRQRLVRAFDQFIDVRSQSDEAVAQLSRKMGIDIAINLSGYTGKNRSKIFALRAAPIQVNYLGFPGTLGAGYIDYLITDKVVVPESSQPYYTEKMAYLPNCFMPHDSTQEISGKPFTRQEFDLPESGFVFCCFNNHYKINPTVFDVWMRLLQQVPGSVLWLSDGNQIIKDNLAKEATARGVDPTRLVFAKRLESMAEHLARYRLADLFLDTPLYNAHTTACDSLWAGVPVLTCAGQSFASRVAASLLTNIELPELVTNSLEDYEALAFKLATHPEMLATIRQKLSDNRRNTPLFDTKRLARDMEKLFSAMYQRYQDGLQPEQIQSGQWANPLLKTG